MIAHSFFKREARSVTYSTSYNVCLTTSDNGCRPREVKSAIATRKTGSGLRNEVYNTLVFAYILYLFSKWSSHIQPKRLTAQPRYMRLKYGYPQPTPGKNI